VCSLEYIQNLLKILDSVSRFAGIYPANAGRNDKKILLGAVHRF